MKKVKQLIGFIGGLLSHKGHKHHEHHDKHHTGGVVVVNNFVMCRHIRSRVIPPDVQTGEHHQEEVDSKGNLSTSR